MTATKTNVGGVDVMVGTLEDLIEELTETGRAARIFPTNEEMEKILQDTHFPHSFAWTTETAENTRVAAKHLAVSHPFLSLVYLVGAAIGEFSDSLMVFGVSGWDTRLYAHMIEKHSEVDRPEDYVLVLILHMLDQGRDLLEHLEKHPSHGKERVH